ncbi:MAG TPA: glycosyltransferase family 2 protein [bacterium]|jgi:GT2 family glycosyltransferase
MADEIKAASLRYKLSIVTANTNERHFTLPMLESVYKSVQKAIPFEFWIVDNNSRDGSVAAIRERFPQVKLICNAQNAGFTEANNQAIRECTGQYVFCLNPDTVSREGAIDRLVEYLDAHPDVGMVGPKLLNSDASLQSSCRNFMTTRHLLLHHLLPWSRISKSLAGKISLTYWDHNSTRDVDWMLGAALMVRRECLNDIGLKDESYFIFHEDSDWCFQAKKKGWRVVFVQDAEIIHHGSQTVAKLWGAKVNIEVYKAQHNFVRKNLGPVEFFMHRSFLTGFLLLRQLRLRVLRLFNSISAQDYTAGMDFLRQAISVQLYSPPVDRKPRMQAPVEAKSEKA